MIKLIIFSASLYVNVMQVNIFSYLVMMLALSCPETSSNVQAIDNYIRPNARGRNGFYKNICDITDRQSQVHCYCENATDLGNAIKAECWIFNEGIPYDDLIWKSFSSQPNLKTLSFNVRLDGALHYIPKNALEYLAFLQSLNIKYGSITEIQPYALANLTFLKEVKLTNNGIKILQNCAICRLPNLDTMNLEGNMIIEINSDVFFDLPKLQKLTFSKNNISVIKDEAFQYLYNLHEMDLDNNNIRYLNRHTFNGLANLQRLDLQNNQIFNLSEFTFAELWNLQELLLGKNNVEFISERAFDGLSQLKTLSLGENKIKIIPPRLLEGVRGLSNLDLRLNRLLTLTFDNIKPILENLNFEDSDLKLEGNYFKCHCSLRWIYYLYNNTKSLSIKSSIQNIKCSIKLQSTEEKFVNNDLENSQHNVIQEKFKIEAESKDTALSRTKLNNTDYKVNILRIPPESLACPVSTTYAPRAEAPAVVVQKEIKSYYRLGYDNSARKNDISVTIIVFSLCLLN